MSLNPLLWLWRLLRGPDRYAIRAEACRQFDIVSRRIVLAEKRLEAMRKEATELERVCRAAWLDRSDDRRE